MSKLLKEDGYALLKEDGDALLLESATKKWEIKIETPTSFTDGAVKTSTVTLTATLD